MSRHTWTLYNLAHLWITRRRNTGLALVKIGLVATPMWMLIRSVYLSYTSIDNTNFIFYLESSTTNPTILDLVGLAIIIVGLLLILYESFFGESAPHNRAKSIDMRSLKGAWAPKLCDSFSATIDQAGLHDDLYFVEDIYNDGEEKPPSKFLPIITQKLKVFSTDFLAKARKEPMKPLALGSIAHVPFCFALGFIVSNKSHSNYYCWNRDNKKWIDCRDKLDSGLSATFEMMKHSNAADNNIRAVGMSIEISFHSDETKFMTSNLLDACVKVSVSNQDIGNIFSDVEQTRIVSQIREYVNKKLKLQFPNLTELHITIMAQASFIMRLGAEFNQNHMPKIYVYHYVPDSVNSYPWRIELTPGQEKIDWKVKEPLEKSLVKHNIL